VNTTVVRIYESELACIAHETSLHPKIETGGSLFGLWTHHGNPTILLASRPGQRAVRQTTQFEQDAHAHRIIEQVLVEHHGTQAIGLWHSHHRLGLHELSGGDIRRTMQFARRTQRERFCDVLCYFSEGFRRDSRSADVTVKPYVYVDAGNGRRAPTSFVVLPGLSPIRAALQAQRLPRDVVAEFNVAFKAPPERWEGAWRLARSVELANREGDDAPVESGRHFWQRPWGRTERAPDRASAAAPEPAAEAPEPPAPDPPKPQASLPAPSTAGDEFPYPIADLEDYIINQLEPALRGAPSGVGCELEPIEDGTALRLTLLSATRTEEHVLDLGWDGKSSVITRHVVRLAMASGPQDVLAQGEVRSAPDGIKRIFQIIDRAAGGR
jgi:hypothetical protein